MDANTSKPAKVVYVREKCAKNNFQAGQADRDGSWSGEFNTFTNYMNRIIYGHNAKRLLQTDMGQDKAKQQAYQYM